MPFEFFQENIGKEKTRYKLKNDDVCIGAAILNNNTKEIELININNDFRNKGYGKELIKHVLIDSKFDKFFVEIHPNNTASKNLFLSSGFDVWFDEREEKYFGKWKSK